MKTLGKYKTKLTLLYQFTYVALASALIDYHDGPRQQKMKLYSRENVQKMKYILLVVRLRYGSIINNLVKYISMH